MLSESEVEIDHFSEVSDSEESPDTIVHCVKTIFLGDPGVGKTNIMTRFTMDRFVLNSKPTLGIDFATKLVRLDNHIIKLQLWDTAGQERYSTFSGNYYRAAQAAILVYDVTRRESFDHLENWVDLLSLHVSITDIVILLIGNKTDLEQERQVSFNEGKQLDNYLGIAFMETTALSNKGDCIGLAFFKLLVQVLKKIKLEGLLKKKEKKPRSEEQRISITKISDTPKSGCCIRPYLRELT